MKPRFLLIGVVAAGASALSGCGADNSSTVSTPAPMSQSLDTAGVLAQARDTSEASEPYAVNGGAVMLTDISDTSEPMAVEGT